MARNTQAFDLAPGDRVEYFIAPGKAIKAGFFVLMVPILVFFLFYFYAYPFDSHRCFRVTLQYATAYLPTDTYGISRTFFG